MTKELLQNANDSRLNDEAITKQQQLDEDAELERQLHEDEEFARVSQPCWMKNLRTNRLEKTQKREVFSSVQANLSKAEKHKYPHKVNIEQFLDERKNCSPKKQTKCKKVHGILHSREKEGAYTLCDSIDGTGEHYAK